MHQVLPGQSAFFVFRRAACGDEHAEQKFCEGLLLIRTLTLRLEAPGFRLLAATSFETLDHTSTPSSRDRHSWRSPARRAQREESCPRGSSAPPEPSSDHVTDCFTIRRVEPGRRNGSVVGELCEDSPDELGRLLGRSVRFDATLVLCSYRPAHEPRDRDPGRAELADAFHVFRVQSHVQERHGPIVKTYTTRRDNSGRLRTS